MAFAIFGCGAWIFAACSESNNPNNPTDGGTAADTGQPDTSAGDAGDLCTTYCNTVGAHCTGNVSESGKPNVATAQYLSQNGCLHACSKMNPGPATGDAVVSGDSVRCRTYHAGSPAQGDPATHCPHAGIVGAGMCSSEPGKRCTTFCRLALAVCAPAALTARGVRSSDIPFADEADCLSVCETKVAGAFAFDDAQNELVRTGNTLNCRQYHLVAAFNDPPSNDGKASDSAVAECPNLTASRGAIPVPGPCTTGEERNR
ncbi:hypothetical protein [Pendulispora albinea]|uniref:Lipoprotein n=1 Tax=Pendulispora albinea TaxID=2741071 RepID=A0ABZ2LNG5_9BACT